MRKTRSLYLGISILVLLLLACSAGYTESGSSQSVKIQNRKGTITKTVNRASGSSTSTIEVSEQFAAGTEIDADVTLKVQKGTYRVEFLDGDEIVLALEGAQGKPARGSATLTLNADGEIEYRITAQDAQKVRMVIEIEIR